MSVKLRSGLAVLTRNEKFGASGLDGQEKDPILRHLTDDGNDISDGNETREGNGFDQN
jgi:hypothetical protein